MTLAIIVAAALNGAIGRNNRLPWVLPEDLAHFKTLTWGHTIIMGHHTFCSLPHGALPGRRNIVVSRTISSLPGCEVCHSLQEALALCSPTDDTVFIIGGASIYRQAIALASVIHLTRVECSPTDADAFFPEIDTKRWIETKKEKHDGFSFITLTTQSE